MSCPVAAAGRVRAEYAEHRAVRERRRRPRPVKRRLRPATFIAGFALIGGLGFVVFGEHMHATRVIDAARSLNGVWTTAALLLMAVSLLFRAEAWRVAVDAAIAPRHIPRSVTARGTMIGVFASAAMPGRLGEPARAVLVARRLGEPRRWLAVISGTLLAQTILNVTALVLLAGIVMLGTPGASGRWRVDGSLLMIPALLVVLIVVAPVLLGVGRATRVRRRVLSQLTGVRSGLAVFLNARAAAVAVTAQLTAWALQLAACWALLEALGLPDRSSWAAAAAVLLAVNVSAVLPATPSNVGLFQAACVAALALYDVPAAPAVAYGILLQALEFGVAAALGVPAMLSEGLSWSALQRGAQASERQLADERANALE